MKSAGLVGVLIILLFPLPALAAPPEPVHLEHLHATITINPDGSISVKEFITLAGGWRSGEFNRVIPLRSTGEQDPRGRMRWREVDVMDRYDSWPGHRILADWDQLGILVQCAGLTDTPPRMIITYEIREAMAGRGEEDILYLPLIGTDQPTLVDRVTAKVHLPKGVVRADARFSIEGLGFGAWRIHPDSDRAPLLESIRPLLPGEKFIVVARFPTGHVAHPGILFRTGQFLRRYWSILLVLGLALASFRRWWRSGREPFRKVAMPRDEAAPLEEVRAAGAGVILDGATTSRDLVAAVFDLAARGHLVFSDEAGDRAGFSVVDTKRERKYLPRFERTLLEAIFRKDSPIRPLSEVGPRIGSVRDRVTDQIQGDLVNGGLFRRSPRLARGTARISAGASIGIILLIGAGLFLELLRGDPALYAGLAIPAIAVIILTSFKASSITRQGREVRSRLRAFKARVEDASTALPGSWLTAGFGVCFPVAVALVIEDEFLRPDAGIRRPEWLQIKGHDSGVLLELVDSLRIDSD